MDASEMRKADAQPLLNESQRRRLSVTLASLERDVLRVSELLRRPPPREGLLTRHVEPLVAPPGDGAQNALSAVQQQLDQIVNDLGLEPRSESVTRAVMSALLLDVVALDEVTGKRLRGYGELNPAAAEYLERELPQLRAALDRLIRAFAGNEYTEHIQQV